MYFTVLRFSADPETRYALVTNFATVSIFKKPFHTISCLAKNCVVSSSVEEFDITALRDNTQNYMTVITMHYTELTLVMIFYAQSSEYLEEVPYSLDSTDEDGFIKIDLGTVFICGCDDADAEGKALRVSFRGA